MKILDVTLHNYSSFFGEHRFQLDGRGLTIVLGDNQDEPRMNSNGAGKSGLFDALDWCLFGKVPRQDHADSMINERAKKDCWVTVRMEDGGKKAVVTRKRAPNDVVFEVDGVDLSALDTSETQAKIERWLGLDRDVFHAAVLYGQLDLMRFADAKDSERIAILTKILQLEEIDEYLERVKAARLLNTEQMTKLAADMQRLDGQYSALKEQDFTGELEAWEGQRSQRADDQRGHIASAITEADRWRSFAGHGGMPNAGSPVSVEQLVQLETQLGSLRKQDFASEIEAWDCQRDQRVAAQRGQIAFAVSELEKWKPRATSSEVSVDGDPIASEQLIQMEGQLQVLREQDYSQEASDWDNHRASRLRDATVILNKHLGEIDKWTPIADQEHAVFANERKAQETRALMCALDLGEWDRRLVEQNAIRDRHRLEQGRAQAEGERLNARREKISAMEGDCSECGQAITGEHVVSELDKIDAELERQRGIWKVAHEQLAEIDAALARTHTEKEEQRRLHHESDLDSTKVWEEIQSQKRHVKEAKDFILKATVYVEDTLRPAMEKTRTESNPHSQKQEKLEQDISTLEARLAVEARRFVLQSEAHIESVMYPKLEEILAEANPHKLKQEQRDQDLAALERKLVIAAGSFVLQSDHHIGSVMRPALDAILAEANPFQERWQQQEEKLVALQAEKDALAAQIAQFEETARYYDFWVEGFGQKGLKSYILDSKLVDLTDAVNQWVRLLTGGTIWVRIETQTQSRRSKKLSNKINVRVFRYNPDGSISERNYRSWSGGEKQRVSLGIDFGLSRLIALRAEKQYDLLILDELFKHLDQSGREAVVDMLQALRQEKSSVLVVDHDSTFQAEFEDRVYVRKQNTCSRIEEIGYGSETKQEGSPGSSGVQAGEYFPPPARQVAAF